MTAHVTPPDARLAASLMLLRDAPGGGVEVLMLRRAERDGDLRSGACVFPGGVLEAADRAAHAWCLGPDDATFSARLGLAEGGLDYAVAAVRESFEEAGVLLACRPDGRALAPAEWAALHAELAPWRLRLHRGEHDIGALCRAFDLRLDLRGLHVFSHWLTPPGVPKRFDTRFFTALMPAGQVPEADRSEAVELMWARPADALAKGSGYVLLPVTRCTLQELQPHASAAAAHAEAGTRRDIRVTMPRRGRTRSGLRIVLPWEPGWAELGRLDPDGSRPASAEIVPGEAVRLSPSILRLTAPNAGMMTGPGTNSYLVGADDPAAPLAVIDPGPDDAAHRAALLAAAPRRITHVLVTHTHADHSPGAAALARATGARVIGRRAPPHPGQDAAFAPDAEPAEGDRLALGAGTTLRALHTPGHASNHVCWLLEEERLLFTGDHLMQGSTVVINPPDGDMQAYLAQLERLLAVELDWLAPGHGFLVAEPHAVIRALVAHRLKREAKVLAALQAAGPCSVAALVPVAYDDTPAALHGVAARSLLAHLLKLAAEGRAQESAGVWRAGRAG
jgi:glyoxylase-like metal-dependent hydrolase (beta-lactamase superfamily II)/8-oxo-dGTP pyrophosphatase MutT (NUDIX family)